MVSKKLQKKWEREAEKYGEEGEIFKIFSSDYGPSLISTFFSVTKDKVQKILGIKAKKAKILGLFVEAWQLAFKKKLPPCSLYDFELLLSEAGVTWEKNECRGATINALRKLWKDF